MGRTRFTKKFWMVVLSAGTLVFAGVTAVSVTLIRFSASDESVCGKCHAEIISLWKNSGGHPAGQTGCAQCHAPGRGILPDQWNLARHVRDLIAPPAYSADDAITTQRCLDCHSDVLAPGYKIKKQIIRMDHRIHYQEGLTCIHCHRAAGHQYQSGGSNRPTVTECLNCHIQDFTGPPKSQKCFGCHEVLLVPGRMF